MTRINNDVSRPKQEGTREREILCEGKSVQDADFARFPREEEILQVVAASHFEASRQEKYWGY
jgi:hypothetical protein